MPTPREALEAASRHHDYEDLTDLANVRTDLRYGTTNNLLRRDVYGGYQRVLLHREAAAKFHRAGALLAEASLSFLGLGVQPPWPSWGQMLARGYTYMEIAPAQMYVPGLAILLTALAYNGLGESLRSRLDPTRLGRG